MINPSRRRASGPANGDALELHLRLARRAALDRRLLSGAVGALIASLLGLLLAPALSVHALIAAAGFAVGAALPTPGSRARAFGTIRDQAGLSYETALELRAKAAAADAANATNAANAADAAQTADPYDFRERVETRARLSVRDVRAQAQPAWWLPLMVVAFGLLLIPGFAPAGSGIPNQGLMSGSQQPSESSPGEQEPSDDETDVGLVDPSSERGAEPDDAGSDDEGDTPPADSQAPGEGDGAAPLSRFLDSLRERPADAGGGRTQEQRDEGPQEQSGSQSGDQGTSGEADPRRFEVGDGSGDGNRDLVSGTGEQDGESPDGEESAQGSGDGQEQGEGPDPASGPRNPFEQAGGPSEESGQEPAGGESAGEGEEGLTPSADGGGDDGADGVSGEGGAGESPAGPAGSQSDDEPEVLRGVLTEGPENLLGTVLLPGRDEVELPSGVSFAQYAAAAEDALTEGDIPLEYQEILRRYFR